MHRTVSILARMCRTSPAVCSRVLSPAIINNVRFKYQNRGGGDKSGRRKAPASDDDNDAGDNAGEFNLLDDK